MNILEDLYYGNIDPNSQSFDRDSEYANFFTIIGDNEMKLSEYLIDDEAKHLFEQLMNAQNEILFTSERERFIHGFRLGARFMLDTFLVNRRSPIKDILDE